MLLEAYEEGTWTPALSFGGNAVGMTYAATPIGRYTRIGRTVFATGSLTLTAKGSSTGAATIAGLPHASAADGTPQSAPIGFASGISSMSGAVIATLAANAIASPFTSRPTALAAHFPIPGTSPAPPRWSSPSPTTSRLRVRGQGDRPSRVQNEPEVPAE